MLHIVSSDPKATKAVCKVHEPRQDYFRNMLGLDGKKPATEAAGWVRLPKVNWIQHIESGAVIAVTGASTMFPLKYSHNYFRKIYV